MECGTIIKGMIWLYQPDALYARSKEEADFLNMKKDELRCFYSPVEKPRCTSYLPGQIEIRVAE